MFNPAPNPNVPQIPQPLANVGSLAYAVQAIKQGVDSLAGNRGVGLARAVTFQDLIALGLLDGAATVVNPYLVTGFVAGILSANQIVFGYQFGIKAAFPANFGPLANGFYSQCTAFVAATAPASIAIEKCPVASDPTVSANWVSVGTATVTGHTGALASAGGSDIVFLQGDRMRWRGPATADATLAQVLLNLAGYR